MWDPRKGNARLMPRPHSATWCPGYCASAAPADRAPSLLVDSPFPKAPWPPGAPSLPSEPSRVTPSYTVQRVLRGQSPPLTALCLHAGFTPRGCIQAPPRHGTALEDRLPQSLTASVGGEASSEEGLVLGFQAPTSSCQQGADYLQIWAPPVPILAMPVDPFQRMP